ncbi:MAG: HNH endonuclease [Clostridia bacterium]|nr:HNH endonuclease [Clostridia bacterium]
MTEYKTAIIIGFIQIILSTNLIIGRKNGLAIFSEIISSLILLFTLNGFSLDIHAISWRQISLTFLQYTIVKVFLVIFMLTTRIYSFYAVKALCRKRKKKKVNSLKLKFIQKINKAKYWPKLKLGLPGMADKTHSKTKVRFDSKGFPKFKTYYTVKLQRKDFRKTREQHFYIANKMLYKNIVSSSRLRAKFTRKEIKEFSQGLTPSKYTWHHHQDAGILQLVDYYVHSKTSHIGGYSIWGGK